MTDTDDDTERTAADPVAQDPASPETGFYCDRPDVTLAERRRIYWLIQAQFDQRIPFDRQVEMAAQWTAFAETGEVAAATSKLKAVK